MTEHLLGYAWSGKELAVMDDLAKRGISHWRGIRIEFEIRGTSKTFAPYEYPALPNYVWIMPQGDQVLQLGDVKHLNRTFHFLSRHGVSEMEKFRTAAEARMQEARAAMDSRDALSKYKEGDRIEIRDGPFAGEVATFRRIVENAGAIFPKIKAELSIMGRAVNVELDPRAVKGAG